MPAMAGGVDRARAAFDRQAWAEARALFAVAGPLTAADLERLAVTAHLVGRDAESAAAWERAYRAYLDDRDCDGGARCAFWLGMVLLLRGEIGKAGGWLARGERLVEDVVSDCPARGLLLVPAFLEALDRGDHGRAGAVATEIVDIGRRLGDLDVLAFGLLTQGEVAIAVGETARGLRLLDEVMVAIAAGDVSPIPTGIVYCAVIEACLAAFDLRRAAEWTEALHGWCSGRPDLVPYRGQCLVHRSQILQAHGAWPEATVEAERARLHLSDPLHPALGLALYQQGELHRLRGEFADAERAYRSAGRHGQQPVPGFALLRLAQGKVAAAVAAVRRMQEESSGTPAGCTVLAAAVEILLAAGDVPAARVAADELQRTADSVGAGLLHAVADRAAGAVLLAEANPSGALVALRRACARWRALEMPYDEAATRVRIGQACRAVDDHDAAGLELDAAGATFEKLGAGPDLAAVRRLCGQPRRPTSLTDRECEVLRLVAAGRTNREIADELVISTHTVGRHVQNIFVKIGLSSRAAATAYAYQHDLV